MALLAIPLLLLVLATQNVVAVYRGQAERLEELRDRSARLSALAARQPQLQATLDRLTEDDTRSSLFLTAPAEPIAAAEVQRSLQRAAQEAGVALTSLQSLEGRTEASLRLIAVQAQITAGPDTLLAFFHQIETQEPVLRIENVSIHLRGMARGPMDEPPTLDVRVTVAAMMRQEV